MTYVVHYEWAGDYSMTDRWRVGTKCACDWVCVWLASNGAIVLAVEVLP